MSRGTDILILPYGKGEKFKYADRWKIKCINPSWIECCLHKGYSVPYADYLVSSVEKKCSTPVNVCTSKYHEIYSHSILLFHHLFYLSEMASLMNANDSDISVIPSDSAKILVGDTQTDNSLTIRNNVFKTPVKRKFFSTLIPLTQH